MTTLTPSREDHFSFGLWTFGWTAADPFGGPTRSPIDTVFAVEKLSELGVWGLTFHDDDLFPFEATEAERRHEIDRLKAVTASTGLVVEMVTTNLFTHPVFKDGGFTSNDRAIRRYALRKVMRNLDLAAELGAQVGVGGGDNRDAMPRRKALHPAVWVDEAGVEVRRLYGVEERPVLLQAFPDADRGRVERMRGDDECLLPPHGREVLETGKPLPKAASAKARVDREDVPSPRDGELDAREEEDPPVPGVRRQPPVPGDRVVVRDREDVIPGARGHVYELARGELDRVLGVVRRVRVEIRLERHLPPNLPRADPGSRAWSLRGSAGQLNFKNGDSTPGPRSRRAWGSTAARPASSRRGLPPRWRNARTPPIPSPPTGRRRGRR